MSTRSDAPVIVQPGSGLDDVVGREFLRHLVCKQITCPETGHLLDVRKAVAVEVTHTEFGGCAALKVTTADAYDSVYAETAAQCAQLEDYTVTVYDGRLLFGAQS